MQLNETMHNLFSLLLLFVLATAWKIFSCFFKSILIGEVFLHYRCFLSFLYVPYAPLMFIFLTVTDCLLANNVQNCLLI